MKKKHAIENIETIQISFQFGARMKKQGKITLCTNLLISQGGCSFYFGLKGKNMETFNNLHTCYFSQGGRISTLG